MNATNAAIPRNTSIVGFTSERDDSPPVILAFSVAIVPLGVPPAPPLVTDRLTDDDGAGVVGPVCANGDDGDGAGFDTGSVPILTGVIDGGGGVVVRGAVVTTGGV